MKSRTQGPQLLTHLRAYGPTHSGQLAEQLGLSRATLSRRLRELGNTVIRLGKGRATQLAARHSDFTGSIPLYEVNASGHCKLTGRLSPIHAGDSIQWLLDPVEASPVLFEGEFREGLYPGWPWFLEDLRPSGFLGRAFAKQMARLFQVNEQPGQWNDLELARTLIHFGDNLPGHFILGDGRAWESFNEQKANLPEGSFLGCNPTDYTRLAELALHEGERYGSSAGGEQPKFTTTLSDFRTGSYRAVIVKFSPKIHSPVGQRWYDLLHAEHTASQVLAEAGLPTSQIRIFEEADRVFLESERFDRIGATGRRGVVSLRTLDAAHLGLGRGTWADAARELYAQDLISAGDYDRMVRLHCFGQLIANTDMHWGNLSFYLPERHPFQLAPVYDMLPMAFRPGDNGDIIERPFQLQLPKPEDESAWHTMLPSALSFWERIEQHSKITSDFKRIARQAITFLARYTSNSGH